MPKLKPELRMVVGDSRGDALGLLPRHVQPALPEEVQTALTMGQSVIPMGADKKPLVKWKRYQTQQTTWDDMHTWSDIFGSRIKGWARITGQLAGVIVLDFDGESGRAFLEEFGLHPHVRTGSGGFHWIGRHPGWFVKTLNSRTSKRLAQRYPGVDIRADGGYSLISGFNHKGGYTWLRDPEPDPLAVLPREIAEFFGLLEPPAVKEAKSSRGVGEREAETTQSHKDRISVVTLVDRALAEAAVSGRNNAGFWLACQLRDNGYSHAEALEAGRLFLEQVPPLNMKGDLELYTRECFLASVDQAYNQPAREPWDAQSAPQGYRYTDLGNALRLVDRHGSDIGYIEAKGPWANFNGKVWRENADSTVLELAMATATEMYQDAADTRLDPTVREQLARHALRSQSEPRLNAMVSIASNFSSVRISASAFDRNPYLVNVLNGTFNLKTGRLQEFRREDYMTKTLPVVFDPGACCPVWDKFFRRIQPDAEVRAYLQRCMGYCLSGDISEQAFFYLYGCGIKPDGSVGDGNNGKSTLLENLRQTLGEYSRKVDIGILRDAEKAGEQARPELFSLRGSRLVIASEMPNNFILNEALEPICARDLYRSPVVFQPTFKVWLYGNYKPLLNGVTEGMKRRARFIEFPVWITPEERDKHLMEKLARPEERSGFLNFLLAGYRDWQERGGLDEPRSVREATQRYFDSLDPLKPFCDEWLEFGPDRFVTAEWLRLTFDAWLRDHDHGSLRYSQLAAELRNRGCLSKTERVSADGRKRDPKGEPKRVWIGVSVRPPCL
jgi:P4 family phage/plasmid primase-like protien